MLRSFVSNTGVYFLVAILAVASVHAQERVTLRLADWASLDEIPLTETILDRFTARYPHINVLYEPTPGRSYEEKILTSLASNDPPDVFLLDSKLIPTFTNKRILLDLNRFVGELAIDTAQWFPNVTAIARRDSGLYAFPKGFTPLMIFYNKALVREAGLSEPEARWDWNDYMRYARKMTVDRDGDGRPEQYGVGFSNRYYYWIPWVWTAGGDVIRADGLGASGALDSGPTTEALRFMIDLVRKEKVAPDLGSWTQVEKTGALTALFANGKIGMILDGHWRLPELLRYIEQGSLDVGVAPFPRYPGGQKHNVMYESGWCVPVNAKHPRAAALLAAFMAGEEACRIRSTKQLEIPSVIKVALENVRNDPLGVEAAFVAEVPFCRQPWGSVIERFSQIEWTLQDAVDEVLINNLPLEETLGHYAKRIDGELESIRAHQEFGFSPIQDHSEIIWFLFGTAGVILAGAATLYAIQSKHQRHRLRTSSAFLAPSLLHLTVFVFTPIAFSAYLSLHRWDLVVSEKPFVGLENFLEMSGDPYFWNALTNTFLYSLNVPIGMLLALGIALLLNRNMSGIHILRTVYFLPGITSFVAIALVWMWIYHPSFGLANAVLGWVGLPELSWLNSTDTSMMSVMLFSVWLGLGVQVVIFLAGLQGIPEEFHDAARIDGANTWDRFVHITLPLLKPTTFFVLSTSLIGAFQVFTSIYVMTAGGPTRSTDVFVYHIYQAAWEQLRMGYASAMSWVLFVIIMIATWIQFRFFGKNVEYG